MTLIRTDVTFIDIFAAASITSKTCITGTCEWCYGVFALGISITWTWQAFIDIDTDAVIFNESFHTVAFKRTYSVDTDRSWRTDIIGTAFINVFTVYTITFESSQAFAFKWSIGIVAIGVSWTIVTADLAFISIKTIVTLTGISFFTTTTETTKVIGAISIVATWLV
jgi:hypothetical protein